MKVARHIIEARREAIAKLLSKVGYVPVLEICKQFNVSEATARRDLTELENQRRITRTHGGALSDFNRNFPPLDDRKIEDAEAKRRIGNLAASRVKAGMTVYLDSGSTIFFAAEAIAAAGVPDLQIVTTCLPTAQQTDRHDLSADCAADFVPARCRSLYPGWSFPDAPCDGRRGPHARGSRPLELRRSSARR
jgi:DeoR/GlpR family transcriptional regulator of sugar metabolism